MIDIHATALTGLALIFTLIGCWLYELSQGRDGNPHGVLMAVGGVAYIVAVGILRFRS